MHPKFGSEKLLVCGLPYLDLEVDCRESDSESDHTGVHTGTTAQRRALSDSSVRLLVSVTVTGSPTGCRRGPGSLTASVRAWLSGRSVAFTQVRSGQTRNLPVNLT